MKIVVSNFESRITSNFKYLYDNHKDFLLSYIKLNFEAVHNIDSIKIFHNSIITYDKYNELIHKSDADMADLTLDNISKAYHNHIDSLFNDINIFKQSIQNVTRENQLKAYSALIQDRFIRAKTWSQKEILVFKISYDCDRITAYYKIQNNEHIYHLYFFTKDFVEINDYIFKTKEREPMILTTGNTDLGKELQSYNIVTLEKAIVEYINKNADLINPAIKIDSISFSSLDINIKYATKFRSYEHNVYHYQFERFRNGILDFIKADLKPVPTETDKPKIIIHDPKTFNSLDTLTNKNLVVIKYVKSGNMPLQSMTVGCYYVAEIETYDGDTYYKLLTRNNFSTTYKDFIKVTKSIPNVVRFEEYPIDTWGEHNNYLKSDTLLYPSFKINNATFDLQILSGSIQINTELFMNQVTRRLRPASGEIFKDCSYIYNTLKNNAGLYDGLKTLYKNSSGKIHQYFNDNKIFIPTINLSDFPHADIYIDEPHRETDDERKAKEAANFKSRKVIEDEEDEYDFWDDVKPKPKKRIPYPINDYKVTGWGKLPEPGDVIVAGMDIATMDRSTIITCIKPPDRPANISGGIEPPYNGVYQRISKSFKYDLKYESDEDQERRILNANRPVKKHTFDESIGLTDDYLLIL